MNRDETRCTLIRVGQTLANKLHLDCTVQSREQGFWLGDIEKSDDVQHIVWEDKLVQIEFRHRFSYVCLSYKDKESETFAEVEFGKNKGTDNHILMQTTTWKPGGLTTLRYLFNCIRNAGGWELLKEVE